MATEQVPRAGDGHHGNLDPAAWERLLAALDPDPRRAAQRYEAIRKKLYDQFRWRGLPAPEELADEALDRAAHRLLEGEVPRNVIHYISGIARLVAFEAARGARKFEPYRSGMIRPPAGDEDPDVERRWRCLERCLDELPAGGRELLLRYEQGQRGDRIAARRAIASGLGIPLNALRIRVHRMRAKLEDCLSGCMAASRDDPRR